MTCQDSIYTYREAVHARDMSSPNLIRDRRTVNTISDMERKLSESFANNQGIENSGTASYAPHEQKRDYPLKK